MWEHRERPPMENIVVEKRYYFRKLYLYQQLFQKSLKIQFSYLIFIKHFRKFLKICQQFVFFVQTRENLTHGLLTYFEKYAKITHYLLLS